MLHDVMWSILREMNRFRLAALALAALSFSPLHAQQGNVARGERDFRMCAACHSLQRDRNMTGPSLAELWGRKAGTLSRFDRFSYAFEIVRTDVGRPNA
jgi:cytochrome c